MSLGLGGFQFSMASQQQISGAQQTASSANTAARHAQSEATQLRTEIERLLMISEALWMFLKKEHGYSDEDLVKRIAEIDLRDGKLDGRVAPEKGEVPLCPKCNRPIGKKRPTCLYCGTALVRMPFDR